MEQVAIAAHKCWFGQGPGLQAYACRQRAELVLRQAALPARAGKNFSGRPLLVVQAEGPAAKVEAFGPLLDGEHGARISADIGRWSAGGDCA
jgi:hypothetical protein